MAQGRYRELTFYHATSESAANSILRSGARNILRDLGAYELGRMIWNALSRREGDYAAATEAECLCLTALRPANGASAGLFSYGDFFVTVNLGNAYRYALNNPLRSEFLYALCGGLSLLRRLGDPLPTEIPRLFPKLSDLLRSRHPPVVLELSGIDEARLRREDGGEDASVLIELSLEMSRFPGVNVPGSFRVSAVSASDIVAVHDLTDWIGFVVQEPPWQPDPAKVAAARLRPEVWAASRQS